MFRAITYFIPHRANAACDVEKGGGTKCCSNRYVNCMYNICMTLTIKINKKKCTNYVQSE